MMPPKEPRRILLLSGSPRKEQSGTLRMATAFLSGMEEALSRAEIPFQTELLHLSALRFSPCRGCLSCWTRQAGTCVLPPDDATTVAEKLLAADVILLAFPLYFFGMPGSVKLLWDRMLPLMQPYRGQVPVTGSSFHGFRIPTAGKRLAVLTSCGYAQTEGVCDPLRLQLDAVFGAGQYLFLPCAQGKTLDDPPLHAHTERYLARYRIAGREWEEAGCLSESTQALLRKPPFSPQTFRTLLQNFTGEGEEG